MKATVILGHPYKKSFNHAIFRRINETLKNQNIETFSHDLYKERFNPLITRHELGKKPTKDRKVRKYVDEMLVSDLLIFVHPNWWGQPPAIVKGYIDRVIRAPYAYDFPEGDTGGGIPVGKLGNKSGIVINTSNTAEERENGYFNDPLASIWNKCVFGFTGMTDTHRKMYRIISDSTERERAIWLDDVEKTIIEIASKRRLNEQIE